MTCSSFTDNTLIQKFCWPFRFIYASPSPLGFSWKQAGKVYWNSMAPTPTPAKSLRREKVLSHSSTWPGELRKTGTCNLPGQYSETPFSKKKRVGGTRKTGTSKHKEGEAEEVGARRAWRCVDGSLFAALGLGHRLCCSCFCCLFSFHKTIRAQVGAVQKLPAMC